MTVGIVFILIMSTTFFYMYLPRRIKDTLLKQEISNARTLVEVISVGASEALRNYDYKLLAYSIDIANKFPNAEYIVFLDAQNVSIASYNPRNLTIDSSSYLMGFGLIQVERFLTIKSPLLDQNEQLGSILLRYSLQNLLETIAGVEKTILFVAVTILTGGSILALGLSNLITFPIRKLVAASNQVIDGNLGAKVEVTTSDELGLLSKTFNLMVLSIRENSRTLEQANEELYTQKESLNDYNQLLQSSSEQLRLNEAKFRGVLYNAPDSLVIANSDRKIQLVNSQAEKIFGYSGDELRQMDVSELFAPLFKQTFLKVHDKLLNGNDENAVIAGVELMGKQRNGTQFSVELSVGSFEVEGQIWTCNAIRDITSRKKTESELIRINEKLELKNQELESFSYSVSHDLRAPLRAVVGYSEILVEEYGEVLDEEGKKVMATIVKNTQKMSNLIDDILAFSKLGRLEMMSQQIDMKEMFQSVYNDLTFELNGRKIEYHLDDIVPAFGDASMIKQLVANLLSNAIKYTGKKELAIIEVKGEHSENGYIYSVKDNGVGFDMQYEDKLFGVFQRLHKEREFPGTGVGLAIVKRILDRHNGLIWVQSEIDKGTIFYFLINN